jgi:hypothetical protein
LLGCCWEFHKGERLQANAAAEATWQKQLVATQAEVAALKAAHERTESTRFRQTTEAAEARAALEAALEAATEEMEATAAAAAARERDMAALQAQLDAATHRTGTAPDRGGHSGAECE